MLIGFPLPLLTERDAVMGAPFVFPTGRVASFFSSSLLLASAVVAPISFDGFCIFDGACCTTGGFGLIVVRGVTEAEETSDEEEEVDAISDELEASLVAAVFDERGFVG